MIKILHNISTDQILKNYLHIFSTMQGNIWKDNTLPKVFKNIHKFSSYWKFPLKYCPKGIVADFSFLLSISNTEQFPSNCFSPHQRAKSFKIWYMFCKSITLCNWVLEWMHACFTKRTSEQTKDVKDMSLFIVNQHPQW